MGDDGFPTRYCGNCGCWEGDHSGSSCYGRNMCRCSGFTAKTETEEPETPAVDIRDAAARAVVFQVLEQAAKHHKDAAKAELTQLEPGDTLAAKWDGQLLGKATMTSGRTRLVVTDEAALLAWLQDKHPTEIVLSANPAYLKALESTARGVGAVIDNQGEIVPGVELAHGEPYVSVRKEKEAPFLVASLLSGGRISLDGIKALPAEPTDRYTQDREAGAL